MSTRDEGPLDFDFFEEGATRESQAVEPTAPASRRPGPPRRPPRLRTPRGATPLLRLAGLVAFAIVIVVLLVVWGQGCASDSQRTTYGAYLTSIGGIGASSAKLGVDLATQLTTPGPKQATLETKLGGLVQQQQQQVLQAQALPVPGPLRAAHQQALEALQLRAVGMQGLLATFKATAGTKDAAAAGARLGVDGRRLEASDVLWQDLFRGLAAQALQSRSLGDLTVPASVFVANVDVLSTRSLTSIWQRVQGASTGATSTGVRGTGIESTTVVPAASCTQGCTGNGQLSTGTTATIRASTSLAFDVSVTNSGQSQEVQVEVTLTIPKGTKPITKKQTIDLIDVGATRKVTFTNFPEVPFGQRTSVQVSVKPVPGETNTQNNSAEYPVVFSLQ